MTRESKVGLFVGLAFIILFAVVIAEKGQRRTSPPDFGIAQADPDRATRPMSGADRSIASSEEGRLQLDKVLSGPNHTIAMHAPSLPGRIGSRDAGALAGRSTSPTSSLPDLPASVVAGGAQPGNDAKKDELAMADKDHSSPAAGNSRGSDEGSKSEADEPGEPKLPPQIDRPAGKRDALVDATKPGPSVLDKLKEELGKIGKSSAEKKADGTDDERPAKATAEPETPKREEVAAGAELRKHKIKAGDSLYTISRKYFGKATPQLVDALYEANRHILKSRSAIRVGQELVIPVVAGYDSGAIATEGPTQLRSTGTPELPRLPPSLDEKPRIKPGDVKLADGSTKDSGTKKENRLDRSKSEPRTYIVRSKDTLGGIAARELGDAGRANDILKMNRDRVSRADRLAVGTKLRLPARNAKSDGQADAPAAVAAKDKEKGEPALKKSHGVKSATKKTEAVAMTNKHKGRTGSDRESKTRGKKGDSGKSRGNRSVKRGGDSREREEMASPAREPA